MYDLIEEPISEASPGSPIARLTARPIMNNLPDDILELFFKNLEFHQLLVVRTVCVRWQLLIDRIIERRPLWIKKIEEKSNYYRFFGIKRVYESKDFNTTHSLLAFRQATEVHARVRKLITYNPFLLVGLELDNLIHLEVKNRLPIARTVAPSNLLEYLFNLDDDQEQTVNLTFKNLRTLGFKARSLINFVIDASRLANLEAMCGLHRIQLVDPRSVTQLSVCHFSNEILSFKNLIKLTVENLDTNEAKKVNLIKHFGSLRELTVWEMKRTNFDKLIKQKRAIQNRTLKLFYKGVDIDTEKFDFTAINKLRNDMLTETSYEAYVAHVGHLNEEFLSQTLLMIQKNLNVPMSHFIKFRNVNSLLVRTHRLSLPNWKLLLKSLKLDEITIAVELDLTYLKCLPKYCKLLVRLSVEQCDNLDWLLELKHLNSLTIRGFPNFAMLKNIFLSLASLRNLRMFANDVPYDFKITENLVSLTRKGGVVFSDSKDSFLYSSLFNTQSWTQLLNVNGNAKCERFS